MGWIKLDDAFIDHPKFLEAGPLAGYLSITAIAWSNRNLTDGFIPRAQINRLVDFGGFAHNMWMGEFTGGGDDAEAIDMAIKLVRVGLWVEVDGGWQIHDYHDWQNTKEEIIAARDAARERQRRSRANRTGGAAQHPVADESQRDISVSHGDVTDVSQLGHGPEEGRSKKEETTTTSIKLDSNGHLPVGELRSLFDYWRSTVGKPNARFTADRKAKVEARLREGYNEADIRKAIDGAARAAFVNDAGKKFDDLELICRTGSKLEGFIERAGLASQTTPTDEREARAERFRAYQGRIS